MSFNLLELSINLKNLRLLAQSAGQISWTASKFSVTDLKRRNLHRTLARVKFVRRQLGWSERCKAWHVSQLRQEWNKQFICRHFGQTFRPNVRTLIFYQPCRQRQNYRLQDVSWGHFASMTWRICYGQTPKRSSGITGDISRFGSST